MKLLTAISTILVLGLNPISVFAQEMTEEEAKICLAAVYIYSGIDSQLDRDKLTTETLETSRELYDTTLELCNNSYLLMNTAANLLYEEGYIFKPRLNRR